MNLQIVASQSSRRSIGSRERPRQHVMLSVVTRPRACASDGGGCVAGAPARGGVRSPGSAVHARFRIAGRIQRIALVLFLLYAFHCVSAQVIPALRMAPNYSAFATFTATKPDLHWAGDYAVYGISAGTVMQTPHLLGVEMRGSYLRSGGLEHQESLLSGPRVAVHYGRFSPYISVLGGAANAWQWSNYGLKGLPKPKLEEGFGTEWSLVGGLGLSFHRRFSVRVGELSYGKIYLSKGRTLTPVTASVGIVYRIR